MNSFRKKYIQVEHPSDIGIEIYGSSLEQLFENAAEGMFSIMCDLKKIAPIVKKNVLIDEESNINLEGLLVLWLEDLIYKFEVDSMLFSKFKVKEILTEGSRSILKADIFGEKIDFKKHEIIVAIKAPTYHMLEARKAKGGGGWLGKVIFDV